VAVVIEGYKVMKVGIEREIERERDLAVVVMVACGRVVVGAL
jgi:hypothetical protein